MVFTRDVLDLIRKDVESTTLPSWLEKIPSGFGGAGHGKLKADHWRTACVVNMVVTLVRLWGAPSASSDKLEVLKNFLHLVIAVSFASRRSMNGARAAAYDYHMEHYLRGLRTLYHHTLVPNHHFSLHLRSFLDLFGPVHGWWGFAFERYNGLLQRMKTNFKPGALQYPVLLVFTTSTDLCVAEMPKTFIRYFYLGTTLRWLMRVTPWPDTSEFNDMVQSFRTAFSDRVRGTRVTDILSFGNTGDAEVDVKYDHHLETPLTPHTYGALLRLVNSGPIKFQPSFGESMSLPRLHPAGRFVPTILHDGVRFATKEAAARDSYIIYQQS